MTLHPLFRKFAAAPAPKVERPVGVISPAPQPSGSTAPVGEISTEGDGK